MKKLLLLIMLIASVTAKAQMQIMTVNELRISLTGRELDFVPFGDTNKFQIRGGLYRMCYDCFNAVDDSINVIVTPYLVDPENYPDLHYVWILARQLTYIPKKYSLTDVGILSKVNGL